VQIPSESIDVTISARTRDCEVGVSETGASQSAKGPGITYWEGPVASGDESVLGYLEMTGYAGDISLK
jgi:predicted secreted hydrolase